MKKISMYQASVPVFTRMLENLDGILGKAAAYAETKKIDQLVLINSRLYPDMFPLARQVQIVSDTAKGAVARLAGAEPPKYADSETTFSELRERVRKTSSYLNTFGPEQIDGSEERTITLPMRGKSVTFLGLPYLVHFAIPNFYFHISTAYGILRHNGVEIGKQDYLGPP